MPSQVRKSSKKKSFRLAEQVRKVKPTEDTARMARALVGSYTLALYDLIRRIDPETPGLHRSLRDLHFRLLRNPNYELQPHEIVSSLVWLQDFAQRQERIQGHMAMTSRNSGLTARLLVSENEDLPDSLADPGEI